MSVIHIYRMLQVVELTTPTGASSMNYPINRTDFTLARYVDNEIDFWVKNIDRKAVPLTGGSITLRLSDDAGRVLITKVLTMVDAAKGLVRLSLTGNECAALPLGPLRYHVVYTRPDAVQVLLCTDRERTGVGVARVIEGPLPPPQEPMVLDINDLVIRDGKYYSGSLPGAALVHNISGQHSAVFNLVGFVGTITIQGTLQAQPVENDWFTVDTQLFTGRTQVVHMPFEGNLIGVRFSILSTSGSFDPIQYLN